MKKVAKGYRLILGYLGVFLIVIGIICLLPLFALIFYPSESQYAFNFVIPGASSIVVGFLMMLLIINREKENLGKHQDSVLLVAIWICAILICAVPFMLIDMSFTDSVFESASCFATVGLTTFTKFEIHLYTFYRAIIAFFGGVGLVLVVTSAISDRYGLKLYSAEGHNDKLLPNLVKSARFILLIYLVFVALGTTAFMIAGMSLFDALCHSISALVTGGMSTKAGGLYEVAQNGNTLAIEIIACVLMLIGATNILLHASLFTGKIKKFLKDCEVRLLCSFFVIFIPLLMLAIHLENPSLGTGEVARYSVFTFISAICTTGFTNFSAPTCAFLGQSAMFIVFFLTLVGGGTGSTSGGIKQYRVALMAKSFYWEIKTKLSSKRVIYPHVIYYRGEEKEISHRDSIDAYGYSVLYIMVLLFCSALITLFQAQSGSGFNFGDCMLEFSSAISSTGMTNGLTAAATTGTKWVLTFGMFAGRLEIIPIYFALFRIGRDVLRKETI